MASHGIIDRVAIVGMGCTPFGERWEMSLDDLIIDAAQPTLDSVGMMADEVDAFWFGTSQSAASGITLATPLRLTGKPVTRVENYCATGSEALRQACYAVASGAYDTALALGAGHLVAVRALHRAARLRQALASAYFVIRELCGARARAVAIARRLRPDLAAPRKRAHRVHVRAD